MLRKPVGDHNGLNGTGCTHTGCARVSCTHFSEQILVRKRGLLQIGELDEKTCPGSCHAGCIPRAIQPGQRMLNDRIVPDNHRLQIIMTKVR